MKAFDNPANAQVLAYLREKSSPNILAKLAPQSELAYTDHTHPELADLLQAASSSLPGRHMPHIYSFLVLINADDAICAFAESTSTLAFRLAEELHPAAVQSGARIMENVGNDWVAFEPWKLRVTDEERIAFFKPWCERAFAFEGKKAP